MKVKRGVLYDGHLLRGWCTECGRQTNVAHSDHFAPGIWYVKCPECKQAYLINILEDMEDLLEVGYAKLCPEFSCDTENI